MPPKRILIVDHDTDAIEILKILLALEGHEVRTAFSGKDALRTVSVFKPEVVLFYIGMRDITYPEDIRNLRWALPRTLIVAMIDWDEEEKENPLHWKEAGFDHHLVKPVRAEDIITFLQQ